MAKRNRTSFDRQTASDAAKARWSRARARKSAADRDSNAMRKRAHGGEPLASDNGSDLDLAALPRETLVELLRDERTAAYVKVRAAEALARLEPASDEDDWRDSPQVRPDYTPPTWDEVLAVARQAGAIE